MVTTSEVTAFARAVRTEFDEKNVTFLAGSIAYTAFVSLVPLLLFFLLALALLGAGWQDRFLHLVTRNVSPTIGPLIVRIYRRGVTGAAGSSLVGLVVLVWAASKLFRGLDTAFAMIYEADADATLGDRITDGVVVLVSLVLAVVALLVTTGVFGVASESIPLLGLFLPLVLAAGLVVAFFPMYYVFPNVAVSPREVLPGVLVAAFGWALLQGLFQVYAVVSTGGDTTGFVTGVMLLATWLYLSGVVLLLGAVVNAILGGHADESVELGAP